MSRPGEPIPVRRIIEFLHTCVTVLKWTRRSVLLRLYILAPWGTGAFIAKGICRWPHAYNDWLNLTAMASRHPRRRFRFCAKTRAARINCPSGVAASTGNGATASPVVLSKQWSWDGGGPEHDRGMTRVGSCPERPALTFSPSSPHNAPWFRHSSDKGPAALRRY